MIHQILHQASQLPPRNPANMVAVPGPHADGSIRLYVFGAHEMAFDTGNVLAVVVLAVGIGLFDEAAETGHGVSVRATFGAPAGEAPAPTASSAVDPQGGDVRSQKADGEGFDCVEEHA
ncbi:MAG: hypothetical protein Q9186_005230 [Xanthomendoza sp. 1 TL-2023]